VVGGLLTDWGPEGMLRAAQWGQTGLRVAALGVAPLRRALLRVCFAAGTPVATEDGPRAIETVEPGEKVWAFNFDAGAWQLCRVVERLERLHHGDMVKVQVGDEQIDATGNHPFWVIEGTGLDRRPEPEHVAAAEPGNENVPGRWVDARDLQPGA